MKCDPKVLALHRTIDAITDRIGQKAKTEGCPVTCRGAGCYWCCYEPVYAEMREVQHALGRLRPEQRKEVAKRVEEPMEKLRASGVLEQTQMENVIVYRKLRVLCPLLDPQTKRCMIYQDRPAGCRLHMAVGNPDDCYDDEKRVHQRYAESNDGLQLLAHTWQEWRTLTMGNLVELLHNALRRKK